MFFIKPDQHKSNLNNKKIIGPRLSLVGFLQKTGLEVVLKFQADLGRWRSVGGKQDTSSKENTNISLGHSLNFKLFFISALSSFWDVFGFSFQLLLGQNRVEISNWKGCKRGKYGLELRGWVNGGPLSPLNPPPHLVWNLFLQVTRVQGGFSKLLVGANNKSFIEWTTTCVS